MTHLSFRKFSLVFGLLIVCADLPAIAQSNAEWQQIRRRCGLTNFPYYNDWVKAGCPCYSNDGGYGRPTGPTKEQIELNQRASEARTLNQKGMEAFNNEDYETSIQYLQAALDKTPNDTSIQQNLQNAKDKLDAKNEFEKGRKEALGDLRDVTGGKDTEEDSGLRDIDVSSHSDSDDTPKKTTHPKKQKKAKPTPTPDDRVNYSDKW